MTLPRFLLAALPLLSLVVSGSGCTPEGGDSGGSHQGFVGREVCAECHADETAAWEGSQHDLAMQEATPATVLADFDEATYTYNDVETMFSRRGDDFIVRTDGSRGRLRDFRVAYTFGVDPLQQYLLEARGGRLQALSIAWDTRPADEGGQRWFHLYPERRVGHSHPLHWTRPLQTWNHMCAGCHSTDLQRNYRADDDLYETSWAEIDVACEACHGPGARHVESARGGDAVPGGLAGGLDAGNAEWVFDEGAANARRSPPLEDRAEIEACARCHARHAPLTPRHEHGKPLADTHRPALLEEGLYFADGQIEDEVYVYGSFLQSRMVREGVRCSDCHDPHTAKTRETGNLLCATCHRDAVYSAPGHLLHEAGTPGSLCVDCHMPERIYMGVDPRRDHSLRVPRPDLTVDLGIPNACNTCHGDRSPEWATDVVAARYGSERTSIPHYAQALHAGRNYAVDAERLLVRTASDPDSPGIARATALSLLSRYLAPTSLAVLQQSLTDPDPLVRLGALAAAEGLDPRVRWEFAGDLLDDPIRSVRLEATLLLTTGPADGLTPERREALDFALTEYREVQRSNADRPDAWLNLGAIAAAQGRLDEAVKAYLTALRLDPSFAAAAVDLADLHSERERDDLGEQVLRDALQANQEAGSLHHALGLLLARQQKYDQALEHLRRAAEMRSGDPRMAYVHAVALHDAGDMTGALEVLEAAHRHMPAYGDLLWALALYHHEAGQLDDALRWTDELIALLPHDLNAQNLRVQLLQARQAAGG